MTCQVCGTEAIPASGDDVPTWAQLHGGWYCPGCGRAWVETDGIHEEDMEP